MNLRGEQTTATATVTCPAIAVVCDTFMSFDSDESLRIWAKNVLKSRWPAIEVDRNARIEAAMGFRGGDSEAQAQLESLLGRAMATAGVDRARYELTSFTARSDMPPSKVWCMAAITRGGTEMTNVSTQETAATPQPSPAVATASPRYSPDHKWWWNGTAWVAPSEASRKDLLVSYLTEQGYRPTVDSDGDIKFMWQGLTFYVILARKVEDAQFFQLLLPNIHEIKTDSERVKVERAAERATAQIKAAKVFVRPDGKNVWADIEEFLPHSDDFQPVFERMLTVLSLSRTIFEAELAKLG